MELKTKIRLLWCALVVALGAIAAFQWGLFAPKDYEQCAESAAKTAKSKEALSILISTCNSKFRGRRKLGGGYAYYDSRQDQHFDIAGANPTGEEIKYIEKQYSVYATAKLQAAIATQEVETERQQAQAELETKQRAAVEAETERQTELETKQRAELEIRQRTAVKLIELTSNIECKLSLICGLYKLTIKVKNNSRENISALSFGWAFISVEDPNCPNSLPTKHREQINLRPDDTTILNIDGYDGPASLQFRYCILVTDVSIANVTAPGINLDQFAPQKKTHSKKGN
jgi:hypothetical protein